MNLEPGLIVVVVALVIFYLRVFQLRGRKKKLERQKILTHMRDGNRKKGKVAPLPPKDPNAPPFEITSWVLVVLGVLFMLVGVAGRSNMVLPQQIHDFWWAPTTIGIIMFTFCFKVT
jgi:hypothetical protein